MFNRYTNFLDKLYQLALEKGIDLNNFQLDHIAYHASDSDNYESIKAEFEKHGELFREATVEGRRVGMFKLNSEIEYGQQKFSFIELVEPLEGQVHPSDFEHAEFISELSFQEIIDLHPELDWYTKNIDRAEFPMLKIRLSEFIQLKFPKDSIGINYISNS